MMPMLKTGASRLAVVLCAMAVAGTLPAHALEFSVSGNVLHMAGPIKSGDGVKFREFYQPLKGKIRIVDLNSSGGKLDPADEIANVIRADGLTTVIDANRSICASACTVLFISGVKRHYVNASAIQDGVGPWGRWGLAFHEGNNQLSMDANHYSGAASALMIADYYSFGVGTAASLLTKAPPEKLYYVSPATAQSLNIATSVSPPEGWSGREVAVVAKSGSPRSGHGSAGTQPRRH
ncbi:MAG: hypothetical protein P4L82_20920 [Ancalomicrobiaceae bacterium]|nr:hypothetical protein [Ancalomicrobiaceae bacterium]